ncbi:MAG: ATP-binding protein [Spirochaetaceae bacterium]|nr:MAG: ATP-binding protein [Spirochaetaceae bacterium]
MATEKRVSLAAFDELDIVMLGGLPACGKSRFATTHLKQGRLRVNRKEIRRMLYEMTHFGEPWSDDVFDHSDEYLVTHVERRIIEHLLESHKKIVIDNTSINRDARASHVKLAKSLRKSIGMVFLDVSPRICLERNASSDQPVPESLIANLAAAMELPDRSEGFREVLVLS